MQRPSLPGAAPVLHRKLRIRAAGAMCAPAGMVVAAASSAMQRRLPRSAGQHLARSSTLCGRPRSYGLRLRAALVRKATNRVHRASSSVGGHFATAGEVRAGQGKAVAWARMFWRPDNSAGRAWRAPGLNCSDVIVAIYAGSSGGSHSRICARACRTRLRRCSASGSSGPGWAASPMRRPWCGCGVFASATRPERDSPL